MENDFFFICISNGDVIYYNDYRLVLLYYKKSKMYYV